MSETNTNSNVNRAKMYQLAMFPMNNGATNVYFVLILTYIATFGNNVLGLAAVFASFMVTGMRLLDAFMDPIIGTIMNATNGKFGKFRPFMVLGNLIMAFACFMLYCISPMIAPHMAWLRYMSFIVLYAVWTIGYTMQTSVTRSAQAVLTNDPKQRPMFTIFNTIGSMAGMGLMQFLAPIVVANVADYSDPGFYQFLAPIGIVLSMILTVMAIIGIWEKDNEKYFGIGGKQEKVKITEYLVVLKNNDPMRRLIVAGAGCKLALSVATNVTVLCMLYGCMMGNYNGLYLPMMVLGYVFSVPFFGLTVSTSQKKGQKASLLTYVAVAFVCYIGVLALLLMWSPDNPATQLSLFNENGLAINLYTIAFLLCFGIGYGAYYSTADMPIPMVADCVDYEMYRSGKFIPGIMGTLFSMVDKLVSSLAATIVGVSVSMIGLANLPTATSPYVENMNWVVIILFCVLPMVAWAATLIAMRKYELSGPRMKEIQIINNKRKEALANEGLTIQEAMEKYRTVEDCK